MFQELFENLLNSIYITLASILTINQNIIKVLKDKNIMFLC